MTSDQIVQEMRATRARLDDLKTQFHQTRAEELAGQLDSDALVSDETSAIIFGKSPGRLKNLFVELRKQGVPEGKDALGQTAFPLAAIADHIAPRSCKGPNVSQATQRLHAAIRVLAEQTDMSSKQIADAIGCSLGVVYKAKRG